MPSRNASPGRAVVIGGSMSGLLAALLLRQAGWEVDVYERVVVMDHGLAVGGNLEVDLDAVSGRDRGRDR